MSVPLRLWLGRVRQVLLLRQVDIRVALPFSFQIQCVKTVEQK